MKNLLLVAAVLFTVSLVSCKKDHTCECVTTIDGTSTTTSTTINDKKSDAEEACNALDSSTELLGITTTVECELK